MNLQQLLNKIYDYIDANIEQYNQLVTITDYSIVFHLPDAKVTLFREELRLDTGSKKYEIYISPAIYELVKNQVFLLKQAYENQKTEKLHKKTLEKFANALKSL